jgi:hypothetical protein
MRASRWLDMPTDSGFAVGSSCALALAITQGSSTAVATASQAFLRIIPPFFWQLISPVMLPCTKPRGKAPYSGRGARLA